MENIAIYWGISGYSRESSASSTEQPCEPVNFHDVQNLINTDLLRIMCRNLLENNLSFVRIVKLMWSRIDALRTVQRPIELTDWIGRH